MKRSNWMGFLLSFALAAANLQGVTYAASENNENRENLGARSALLILNVAATTGYVLQRKWVVETKDGVNASSVLEYQQKATASEIIAMVAGLVGLSSSSANTVSIFATWVGMGIGIGANAELDSLRSKLPAASDEPTWDAKNIHNAWPLAINAIAALVTIPALGLGCSITTKILSCWQRGPLNRMRAVARTETMEQP